MVILVNLGQTYCGKKLGLGYLTIFSEAFGNELLMNLIILL
jgi:hypothetical protein